MVNARRSELKIIDEILSLSKNGAKTTELLYQCNLSYTQCKSYISFLLEKSVLMEKSEKNGCNYNKVYYTTQRGNDLLLNVKQALVYLE